MGVSALELRRRVLMAQPHKERKTGGIVSFNTHVPQVLGVSVPLSPVQAGTGDPYPPGGGINLINVADRTINLNNQYYVDVPLEFSPVAGETYTLSVEVTTTEEPFNVSIGCGTIAYSRDIASANGNSSGRVTLTFTPTEAQLEGRPNLFVRAPRYSTPWTATAEVKNFQLEKGSTAHDFAPYSNIRPISGHDGAAVWRTEKNLCFGVLNKAITLAQGGVSVLNSPGTVLLFYCKKGETYTYSGVNNNRNLFAIFDSVPVVGSFTPVAKQNTGLANRTFIADKDGYGAFYVANSEIDTASAQIEPGEAASEYAPYSGESFPFTFPDTVYGGRLEPAAGRVVVEYAIKSVRDFGTWYAFEAGGYKGLRTRYTPLNANKSALMCSHYQAAVQSTLTPGKIVAGSWYYNLALCDPDHFITQTELFAYADAQAQAGQPIQIYVPLAEPLIVPLTPAEIRALMGENNVFADTGNVDVEFWTN